MNDPNSKYWETFRRQIFRMSPPEMYDLKLVCKYPAGTRIWYKHETKEIWAAVEMSYPVDRFCQKVLEMNQARFFDNSSAYDADAALVAKTPAYQYNPPS